MKHFLSLCLAAVLTVASLPAFADTKADAQLAISELKGDAKLFAVTQDGHIYHRDSGLVCSTKIADSDRVKLVVVEPGKGSDIRCDYLMRDFGRFTVQVTKLPPGLTARFLMPAVVQSVVSDLKDPRPVETIGPETVTDPTTGQVYHPLTQSFTSTYNMQVNLTRIWLGDINGWAVKSIANYQHVANSPGEGWGRSLWIGAATSVGRKTQ